jgi:signal transduction histidine kinase
MDSPSSSDMLLPPEPPAAAELRECGRLVVELRVLGMICAAWFAAQAYAVAWLYATVAWNRELDGPIFARLVAPQFIALAAVAMRTLVDLPAARWDRRGAFLRRGRPWSFLLAGWPLWPLFPVLRARDRVARRQATTTEAHTAAFQQLLRLPRLVAWRLAAWWSVAFAVDAILVAERLDVPRGAALALGIVWIGGLFPLAVGCVGWCRRLLRPEVLTVPDPPRPLRELDLRWRLQTLVLAAGLGMLAALCAGAWSLGTTAAERAAARTAEAFALQCLALAESGRSDALGRLLARHPDVTVEDARRRIGPPLHLAGDGLLDADGDGTDDTFVVRSTSTTVAVPLPVRAPALALPLSIAVLLGSTVLVAVNLSLARDAHRDVARATAQVAAVADGRAPPPLGPHSFGTADVRSLVDAVDRLVGRITEGNVEKYVAIEKAKEADRLKSQFLANMSHDLRSPLNSVLGFSELLLSGIDGPLTDEQREMIQLIHECGRALLQQIDDILDTAKLDAGRLELHPEPTPPTTIVTRAVQNAKKRRPEIDVVVDAAAGLPPAFVDPYRTVQALENVITFASTRMTTGALQVRLKLSTSGRRRVIAVDVRTPVPPASAERLALARRGFHRIPGHRGLGLSLPIAGAILELQGGALAISEKDGAMVFRVELRALELRRATNPGARPGKTEVS